MSYINAAEVKQKLDELIAAAEFFPGPTSLLEQARSNFVAAGVGLAEQVAPWLWTYYRATYEMYGAEDREEYGIPEIMNEASIWQHVHFRNPPTISIAEGPPYEPDASYISFEGEVAWEEEHGLQLVFSDGQTVCRVGAYNGHHTNARASADASLIGIIFQD